VRNTRVLPASCRQKNAQDCRRDAGSTFADRLSHSGSQSVNGREFDMNPPLTPPSRRRAEAALWRAAKAERGTEQQQIFV